MFLTAGALQCLNAQAPAPCLARPVAERAYTRARLLEMVTNQTPIRAAYLIRQCGVLAPFDSSLEADLREAGGGELVLTAVRAVAASTTGVIAKGGETRTNPKDGLRYAYVPAGTFRMGCSTEPCPGSEKPAHEVRISKGFWMGQTTVTVEAFKKFVRANGRRMPDEPMLLHTILNPNWSHEADPMILASWFDARDYCEWSGLRLPTEAEWEYAARAGTTGARYGELNEIAWWAGNAGNKPLDLGRLLKADRVEYEERITENGNRPHGVAQKRPNAFKLYDMLGNVWQWTSDWYKSSYDGEGPETDPQGPPGGEFRVMRGGSFFDESAMIRASFRSRTRPPGLHGNTIGFRCSGAAPGN